MIYLIHFNQKVGGHARHYLGYTANLKERLKQHQNGQGAALMAEVARLGYDWQHVRTWQGDRNYERKLKNRKNARHLCPICNPQTWQNNAPQNCLGQSSHNQNCS